MARPRWLLPLLATAITVALVAGGLQLASRPSTLERIERRGVVRIGYVSEPPYAFRTPAGRVTGESPELARRVFRRLGIDSTEWVQTDFDALIPQLRAGRFDAIASGLFDLPERRRLVSFSLPVACVAPALLVRAGNPLGLRDAADLARPRVRVTVILGSYEARRVRELGVPPARVLTVPDARAGYGAVLAGGADALYLTAPALRWLADSVAPPGTVEAVTLPAPPESESGPGRPCSALAVRREDEELREAIDRELRRFVGSPEHVALVRRFGFAPTDLPAAQGDRGAEEER